MVLIFAVVELPGALAVIWTMGSDHIHFRPVTMQMCPVVPSFKKKALRGRRMAASILGWVWALICSFLPQSAVFSGMTVKARRYARASTLRPKTLWFRCRFFILWDLKSLLPQKFFLKTRHALPTGTTVSLGHLLLTKASTALTSLGFFFLSGMLFLHDSVLAGYKFLGMYPFLLGYSDVGI